MVPHRLEEASVRAEADEEDPEVVLGARLAVGARVLRARGLRVLRADGDEERELNRRLDLARVGRAVEEAVLDGVLAAVPEVVEVEGAVAGAAVVVEAVVAPRVVGVADLRHRRVPHRADAVDESVVGLARVGVDAVLQGSRRLQYQLLLLVEGLDEVLYVLGGEVRRADVDVESRAAVGLRPGLAELPHHLLQEVEVGHRHDWRDHLGGGAAKAPVADHLPLASVGHRHRPVVEVVAFVPRRSAGHFRDHLRGALLADSLVLEFASEGAARHLCLCYRHCLFPFFRFRFVVRPRALPPLERCI